MSSMVLSSTLTDHDVTLLSWRKACRKKTEGLWNVAWRLLSEKCAKIICSLRETLRSPDFVSRHRHGDQDFTRQRKLPFYLLFCFLINFVKGAYQHELDKFFQTINGWFVARRVISKAAFAKARLKIKAEAFTELNQRLVTIFATVFTPRTWQGFRLLAIDSTTIRLPRAETIAAHFGVWNVRQGRACPMARATQVFDVLNKISLNAIISPKSSNERIQALELFSVLQGQDLVLLDRGYPAYWLFALILARQANFCARMPKSMVMVKELLRSRDKEKVVAWAPPCTSLGACEHYGIDTTTALTLRLIRIDQADSEPLVLATSLLDAHRYPYEMLCTLYQHRWPVEEDYKTIKCWLEMENFTGKSVLSIYQDFHAKMFFKNLTAILSFASRCELEKAGVKQKHVHQLNFVHALAKSKHVIVLLFRKSVRTMMALIQDLHLLFLQTTEPLRPDRKYPRKVRMLERRYFPCYKPIA